MGIPIITELNREITRLYIAGSPLAKGDPRIAKFIAPLEQLGQRAPVFQALAKRLTELTQGGEHSSPEKLMEAGMLVNSIIYTQGSTEVKAATEPVAFGSEPLAQGQLPYSLLHKLYDILSRQSQEHSEELVLAYESGRHRDPRLYRAYCRAIGERRSFVSDYVLDFIIPSIGSEMISFLESELNLDGTKRDARIFKALYGLKGKDILPLSLKALEAGSVPVVAEAIYTLCEDAQYEEVLRGYLGDKKAEIRQAAFTTLARLDADIAEESILKELKRKSVTHLAEVLKETDNSGLAAAVLAEVKAGMPEAVAKPAKLKILLEVLAVRPEPEGLAFIKSLYFNRAEFDKLLKPLELHELLSLLYQQDVPEKNLLVYEIACENVVFMEYRVYAAVRLFAPEQVYELCYKDCSKFKQLRNALYYAYHFDGSLPDAQKYWDRRWAYLFLKARELEHASSSLFADDIEGWSELLSLAVTAMANNKSHPAYYLRYLKRLKEIGHPEYEYYYQKFLAAGFAKEVLAERMV